MCFYELKQTNNGALMSLKGYIFVVSIEALASNFSGWLAPLGNAYLLHLYLYLFW